MANTQLCLDTNALIDYLKGREPGAAAVEKAVKEYNCCRLKAGFNTQITLPGAEAGVFLSGGGPLRTTREKFKNHYGGI